MVTELSHYLDSIKYNLRLDSLSEREVTSELETHIEDRLQELRQTGLSEEEAANTCIKLLGPAKLVARQIYEDHSQGTWKQTLLASTPHLLFALLFTLNWWQGIGWLLSMLVFVLGMAIYGWWCGKPIWLFPWLGYSLLPVVVAGLLLLCLPKGWSWTTILLYIPLALWLLYRITVQTIKRDWLYSSLMLFPVPIILGWFLAVHLEGRFPELSVERLHDLAPWVGLSFLVLAITVALFVRLRQRWLKVAILFISGLLTLIMAACYAEGRLGLPTFLVLILVLLGLFLTPALLERKIRGGG
ncbi:permease prefix domain 1-containing protein [Chloroflexota bacterium]